MNAFFTGLALAALSITFFLACLAVAIGISKMLDAMADRGWL